MKTRNQFFRNCSLLLLMIVSISFSFSVRATELTITSWTTGSLSAQFNALSAQDKALVTKITVAHETTAVNGVDLNYIRDNFMNLKTLNLSSVNYSQTKFVKTFGTGGTTTVLNDPVNNYNLESISLPRNIVSIAGASFKNLQQLKTVVLPPSVIEMEGGAFQNCPKLTNINTENVTSYTGTYNFYVCTSLTNFTFNEYATNIPANMFNGCTSLAMITLPNNSDAFTIVNGSSFTGCTGVTKVICKTAIPPTVTGNFLPTLTYANCKLYVPAASVEDYKTSSIAPWSSFDDANILSIDEIAYVMVTPTTASIAQNKNVQLIGTVIPGEATDKSLNWTSADNNIATVDANGLVTAKNVGTVRITATMTIGGKTVFADITVTPASTDIDVTGVSLSPNSGALQIGSTVTLTPTIAPSNATHKGVRFSSNKPSVATVDSITGIIKGISVGTAIITVRTIDGNFKANYTADVYGQNLLLPAVISTNMVIQQDMQATLWGWCAPNDNIQITTTWGQSVTTTADAAGRWTTKIQTPKAVAGENQTQHTLTFTGKNNTITVSNVLVGDVYLCSGQSNMVFEMNRLENAAVEIAAANYPNIRINEINSITQSYVPLENCTGSWNLCNPTTVTDFSAVAYYFARKLYKNPAINIPIGVIQSATGGSGIQAWISRESLSAEPELKSKVLDVFDQNPSLTNNQSGSTLLYNTKIAPLSPLSIKGFLWYQGEANNGTANYRDLYYKLLKALITGWRDKWGQGDLPFYYVQMPAHVAISPILREQQTYALTLPKTAMVVILDISHESLADLHPLNKKDLGARLGKIAEANIYNQNVVFAGPMLQSYALEENKIRIKYDPASIGNGLAIRWNQTQLNEFKIAGSDGTFYDATAVIDGNDVLVSSPSVTAPLKVRFAYSGPAVPNLMNKDSLTAYPFDTDTWDYSIRIATNSISHIDKVTKNAKLSMYPNPVTNNLNIHISNPGISGQVQVFDLSGNLCLSSNFATESTSFDVSHLPGGFYLLRYYNETESAVGCFIKK